MYVINSHDEVYLLHTFLTLFMWIIIINFSKCYDFQRQLGKIEDVH